MKPDGPIGLLVVVDAARAVRLAKSGEERARALAHLFTVVDLFDGVKPSPEER